MSENLSRPGLAFGAGAYLVWGTFPLLMNALRPAGALEITAHRAVWSVLVCFVIVAVMRGWRRLRAALVNRRTLGVLAVAAFFIAINWLIYVYAVVTDHVNSAALGYYINPLFTVALGVIFLGERLRRLQVVAIGIAVAAVVVIGVGLGEFPWIALALATSFGLYGLIKKRVGGSVDAITGLTVETLVLLPVALVGLWWIQETGRGTFGERGEEGLGLGHDLLLMSTGVFTAGALLLFAAGARRLPLYVTGLLQYIAPTLMFILAVWHFGEPMPVSRCIGFILVWVALVVLTVDGWRGRPRRGVARVEPAEPV
ncbi:EamA family transporter RarD [Demequina activiva]|uniref:Protein RarD n=1 Tax=Demequina activiva TaxID=1582364 RepID=A0A919UGY0_9MICO|nr:EamA family transporter RarD [Demequina activiva]GIG54879.1 protein RarD [Demequina activiva]